MIKRKQIISLGVIALSAVSMNGCGTPLSSNANAAMVGQSTYNETIKGTLQEKSTDAFLESLREDIIQTEKQTEKQMEKQTEKQIEKQTEKQTEKQVATEEFKTTKTNEVVVTNDSRDIGSVEKTLGGYLITPFMTQYNDTSFLGYNLIVDVQVLRQDESSSLIEMKTGNENQHTIRANVFTSLFKDGLSAFRIKGHHLTLINEKEGMLLYASINSAPGRSQAYVEERFATDSGLVAFFAHSFLHGVASTREITNTDTEWRGIVKVENKGYVVKDSFFAEGYMAVVINKVNNTSGTMYCFKKNPTAEQMSAMHESVKNFTFTAK